MNGDGQLDREELLVALEEEEDKLKQEEAAQVRNCLIDQMLRNAEM